METKYVVAVSSSQDQFQHWTNPSFSMDTIVMLLNMGTYCYARIHAVKHGCMRLSTDTLCRY